VEFPARGLVLVAAVAGLASSALAEDDASRDPAKELLPVGLPLIGNINGVKLSIPRYFFGEDESFSFLRGKRDIMNTYDTPIENLAIIIRLSNLEPMRTRQNLHDHLDSGRAAKPYYFETWTTVGVHPEWYRDDLLQHVWDAYHADNDYIRAVGPFTRQERLEFDLVHATSPHPFDDGGVGHYQWGQEIYYDESSHSTFITCESHKMVVAPHLITTTCKHDFVIPEYKSIAQATYSKSHLSRWREIEAKLHAIFTSFIDTEK
jgi:hypothetical protein